MGVSDLMVAAGHSDQPLVLELAGAHYRPRVGGASITFALDLSLRMGQLVYLQVDRQRSLPLVGDACCGLIEPARGEARFMGRAWRQQSAEDAAAMRAGIGRMSRSPTWLPSLTVAENILLAQMHHTRVPREQLMEQAAALAGTLALPGLPLEYPGEVSAIDLNRAAIVRALMGRPQLLILELPDAGDPEVTTRLLDRVLIAQDQGAAILWLDHRLPRIARDQVGMTACYRLRRSGELERVA
ncbi:MAG: ATP-binding cassette domain-containing protein [Planctomycetes bacterium]|jgi:phospholipid/cholesterol/gamma-HCH transport system ATP-binding protein|nr:ATP-binding cassette domain-containing protein [Planctomycetota bacterium]